MPRLFMTKNELHQLLTMKRLEIESDYKYWTWVAESTKDGQLGKPHRVLWMLGHDTVAENFDTKWIIDTLDIEEHKGRSEFLYHAMRAKSQYVVRHIRTHVPGEIEFLTDETIVALTAVSSIVYLGFLPEWSRRVIDRIRREAILLARRLVQHMKAADGNIFDTSEIIPVDFFYRRIAVLRRIPHDHPTYEQLAFVVDNMREWADWYNSWARTK